uniref:RING-type E3 ubiquitin transferase n=1 Tax=Lygus hesperus TaxID=30085 RepID=A0A0K8T7X7_LYGHE
MAEKLLLKKLTVKEVICPICREIFIEPVSLPCKHIVCLQCLEQTVENNTLSCPICRTWIGTFLRLAKNRNKIVNHKLWEQLKKQFPREIERKCNGEEDGISNQLMEDQPRPSLTTDRCSIKKEFDDLLNKLKIEEEKCRKAEQSASEKLAQQLMEEELEAERRRKTEERSISTRDSILARSMVESESENWEPDDMQADSTSNDDDMDVENGRDSISIEFRHFTPICIVPKTPPNFYQMDK